MVFQKVNFLMMHSNITVFIFVFSILCFSGCGKDETIDPPLEEKHLEYFGFTLVDTYWDDPTDSETKINYSDEVHSFSNMADILVVGPSDNIAAKIQDMQDLQMKGILHLNEIFFEVSGSAAPSGVSYGLRSDYQSRWDEFSGINNLVNIQDNIQAFYIGEEPTWNDISFSELKSASDYVKTAIPNVPIMIVEAYPIIGSLQIPTSVDWVGFDHYFVKDPKNDPNFLSELNVLKSKLSTDDQKLIFIMDTHYIDFAHGDFGGITLAEMKDVATSYYELAKAEPKSIGILGYFWPSGFDDVNAIGARHMPQEVKDEYIRIGKEITGKN